MNTSKNTINDSNEQETTASLLSEDKNEYKNKESNEIKLVKHPFFITDKEDVLLFRNEDFLEYHFDGTIFSKTIDAQEIESNLVYLECTSDENGFLVILDTFSKIYEFKEPVDFYFPQPLESQAFYKNFHQILLDDNLHNFVKHSDTLNDYLKTKNFPDFFMEKYINIKPWDMDEKGGQDVSFVRIKAFIIKTHEDTPKEHPENIKDNFIKNIGQKQYDDIQDFIKKYFLENILTVKEIEEIYKNATDLNFTLYALKYAIIEHYYIFADGPWRKCWIKFGYDPKTCWDNYIFQKITFINHSMSFQIKDNKELLKEIEKKREWYILKTFEPKNGFLSNACLKLIDYFISNKQETFLKKSKEDEEFEIFD
ncbi:hypothetical protein EHP00_1057 [Ecytonucleospora hepatopenaei]|uniref:Transcription factor IIIC subunit 5 HTH domain-containing protein n=1 Tax=Ecytonucleospora hepatopenaei TaxID=646526 RepID=A0A1W0E5I3_9MICR|nr:hypothetical protein EHP00_1057 [Ecytonucleospora hepatopenaei]